MQQITEQQILAMAPNAAAASNGRKISQKGGFVRLEHSADDTFYMGECSGSGKSNYITSADFIEGAPVCRCTCPSRQFPCKHGLALLYEILAQKTFGICEIPDDIVKKREKKISKEKDNKEAKTEKKTSSKTSKAAKTKKLKKQLEGLEMLEKLIQDLLRSGLGTMGGTALKTYKELAKQLGDYYLPGPQRLLQGLIIEMEAFQKDNQEIHYDTSIDILEKMWTLVKKSKEYLTGKIEQDNMEADDSMLYEELGGIWKLSELEALGRSKKDVELIQLSFWSLYDEAGKQYTDTGCWADLNSGEIFMTYNYRPLKALKYIKQEDTVFGVAKAQNAACYPGEGNLRIRWEDAAIRDVSEADMEKVRNYASGELKTEVKTAKNILKNALADNMLVRLLEYEQLGQCDEGYVLCTKNKETILLGDAPGMEASCERISLLPDEAFLKNQVLLGAFYYDAATRRFKLQPLSIITEHDIIRLLY